MARPDRFWLPFVLLLTLALLALRFPDWWQHGNTRVIEAWGDGYKTYHALTYHARHDSTASWFMGMNYPYGEHAIPGDTQPLLSISLQWLRQAGLDLTGYTFGILHGSMLLGLVLSALFLYLLFRQLRLPAAWAAVLAAGITFLAPQLDRFEAHFGLARAGVFPIVLYLLYRWTEQRSWRWSLLTALAVSIYAAFHFYFFAVLAFLIGGYLGMVWLLERDWSNWWRYGLHLTVMVLLPAAFFFGWLYLTDPVADRNEAPWGFFAFNTRFEGILTSLTQPHWRWVDEHIIRIERVNMESWAYAGLAALALLVFFGLRWLFRRMQGWPLPATAGTPRLFLHAALGTGTAILIFSSGFPFVLLPDGELWVEQLGPLRQFRSIGRFAWVFFYTANIAAFAGLYYHWHRQGRTTGWSVVVVLATLVLAVEALHYTRNQNLALDVVEEWQPGQAFTAIDSVNWQEYQAILPIPYYNLGSDNFWWDVSGYIGQKSQTLSMQTGLPMTAAMLTRTSLSETLNQLQLVTEPYRLPALLDDLPDDRPLLLAWDTERIKEYGDRFDHLLEGAEPVHIDSPLILFRLPLGGFADRIDARLLRLQARLADTSLLQRGPWLSSDNRPFVYLPWEERAADRAYAAGGAFTGRMETENVLLDTVMDATAADSLQLSCWMYLQADRYARTEFTFAIRQGEQEIYRHTLPARELAGVFDPAGWALLEWPVVAVPEADRLHVHLTASLPLLGDRPLWVDELLLQPAGQELFRLRGDSLWYNNRHYPTSPGSGAASGR